MSIRDRFRAAIRRVDATRDRKRERRLRARVPAHNPDMHVDVVAEDFRTRVRFPPPPPSGCLWCSLLIAKTVVIHRITTSYILARSGVNWFGEGIDGSGRSAAARSEPLTLRREVMFKTGPDQEDSRSLTGLERSRDSNPRAVTRSAWKQVACRYVQASGWRRIGCGL